MLTLSNNSHYRLSFTHPHCTHLSRSTGLFDISHRVTVDVTTRSRGCQPDDRFYERVNGTRWYLPMSVIAEVFDGIVITLVSRRISHHPPSRMERRGCFAFSVGLDAGRGSCSGAGSIIANWLLAWRLEVLDEEAYYKVHLLDVLYRFCGIIEQWNLMCKFERKKKAGTRGRLT